MQNSLQGDGSVLFSHSQHIFSPSRPLEADVNSSWSILGSATSTQLPIVYFGDYTNTLS
jgi:hypothetical protein